MDSRHTSGKSQSSCKRQPWTAVQVQHTSRLPWRVALGGKELLPSIKVSWPECWRLFFSLIVCGEVGRGTHHTQRDSQHFLSKKGVKCVHHLSIIIIF